jgi:hypothetical protein
MGAGGFAGRVLVKKGVAARKILLGTMVTMSICFFFVVAVAVEYFVALKIAKSIDLNL